MRDPGQPRKPRPERVRSASGNVSNSEDAHDEMAAVVGKTVVSTALSGLTLAFSVLKPSFGARMTLPVKLGVFAGMLGTASAQGM